MLTASELLTHLKALGDNCDQVARSLADKDIKGYPGNAKCCPLANYVRTIEGSGTAIAVTATHCVLSGIVPSVSIRLPFPCSEFARAFDSGSYEHLVGEWKDVPDAD